MMSEQTLMFLWRGGLGAIPVVAIVFALTRLVPMRPATRHLLWATALLSLLSAPIAARWLPAPALEGAASLHDDAESEAAAPESVASSAPAIDALALRPGASAGAPPIYSSIPWRNEPAYTSPFEFGSRMRMPAGSASGGAPAADQPIALDRDIWLAQTPRALIESQRMRERRAADKRAPSSPLRSAIPLFAPPAAEALPAPPRVAPAAPAEPAPGAVADAPAREADQGWLSRWSSAQLAALGAWRDRGLAFVAAVRAAPPIPTALWLGGSLVALGVFGLRCVRASRWLKATAPAPADVADATQRVARRLGLPRAPQTRITERRVSPFIWCGRKPKLIIPTALWDELDDAGRDAILHHELAHLKRRDHVLRWADLAAGVAYWWHPLVWFIRRRLRDEADLCCDAWVTALLPGHRRAYAQALVRTKAFLSTASPAPTAIGLESASVGAKRFARRLTMVMLHRTRPGVSIAGLLLVLSVGAVGLASAPIFACPPQKKDAKVVAVAAHPKSEEQAESKSKSEAKGEEKSEAESKNETTFEKYLNETERKKAAEKAEVRAEAAKARAAAAAERAKAAAERAKVRAKARAEAAKARAKALAERAKRRVEVERSECPDQPSRAPQVRVEIEQQMANAERRLAQMRERIERAMRDRERLMERFGGEWRAFARERDDDCDCKCDCDDDNDEHGDDDDDDAHEHAHVGGAIGGVMSGHLMATPAPMDGEAIERSYSLPKDKLEALTALMALDSVPVLVRPGEDSITVIGTPAEQRIFAAFVRLLSGDAHGGALGVGVAPMPPMAPVAPRPPRAGVGPAGVGPTGALGPLAPAQLDAIRQSQRALGEAAQAMRHRAQAMAAQAERMMAQRQQATQRVRQLGQMREQMQRQVEQLMEQARQIQEQAGQLQERASESAEGAGDVSRQREQIMREVQRMLERAEAIRARAEETKARAESLEDEQSDLDDKSGDIDDRAQELRERAQEFAESFEDRLADLEEEIADRIESMREAALDAGADQSEIDEALREALAESMGEISEAIAQLADEIQSELSDDIANLHEQGADDDSGADNNGDDNDADGDGIASAKKKA